MGLFDQLTFRSPTAAYGSSSLANRINWDNRTLIPGRDIGPTSKPWDSLCPDDALQYSAWYRALVILSTQTGGMEIDLKRVEDNDGELTYKSGADHEAYWPIVCQANQEETAPAARARMIWIAAQYGSSYAAIIRESGKPNMIVPFGPYQCWPERIEGKKWFLVDPYLMSPQDQPVPQRMRKLDPADVIDVSLPSNDGFFPNAPWEVGKMTLHEGVAGARVRSARAINSGRPRVALTTPQFLKDETIKRIRSEFPAIHTGLDDQIVPAILDGDLKPTAIPYQPEYAAEESLYGIGLRGVSNLTGVPQTFLGDVDSRSYNALESDIKMFFEFGLGVWLNILEDQYRSKMLSPNERRYKKTMVAFNRTTTRFADTKTMAELIRALGAGAPVAKINEIRATVLGMSALPDEEAKKLLLPKNMGEDGTVNDPKPGTDKRPGNQAKNANFPSILPSCHDDNLGEQKPAFGGLSATKLIAEKIVVRMAREAERDAGCDKKYMQFAGDVDTNYVPRAVGDFVALVADGGVWDGKDHVKIAGQWVGECKERLLDLAGFAKKGELDGIVKREIPKFIAAMPFRLIEILEAQT